MTDEPTTPSPSENTQRVELVQPIEREKAFGEQGERGLHVVPMNVAPEATRPSGGGDIPPPVSAEPSAPEPPSPPPATDSASSSG